VVLRHSVTSLLRRIALRIRVIVSLRRRRRAVGTLRTIGAVIWLIIARLRAIVVQGNGSIYGTSSVHTVSEVVVSGIELGAVAHHLVVDVHDLRGSPVV
jgi:hypothetical protein